MSKCDATTIIGQFAGLARRPMPRPAVSPEDLIDLFCTPGAVGGLADTVEAGGLRTTRGFCGNTGGAGGSMVVGFDDGYDFMGYLVDRGWVTLPAKGRLPYVVYLARLEEEEWSIASYIEGDLAVWQFDSGECFARFYGDLPATDC